VEKFVARQPIFDGKKNIFGYELLFRSSLENFFQSDQPDQASSRVVVDSFLLFGMQSLTGGRRAFLNFTHSLLVQQYATLLPREQAVVEILETVEPDDQIVAACKILKDKGYLIALDDFIFDRQDNPLIKLAKIVKVDFLSTPPDVRQELVKKFRPLGIEMLAEKVETYDDFREAIRQGYTYFQGFFFCKPEILSGRDIPAFKLNYLSLLRAINQNDPNLFEVEQMIKRESSLCYKLLRYLNSAAFYFHGKVTSIRHALSLLGIKEVRRWASLVALAVIGEDKPQALVVASMIRACFCELLAPRAGFADRTAELFLTGLLSMMDAILEKPMESILQQLPVSPEVKETLLGGKSSFQDLFELVTCYDKGDWRKNSELAARLKLDEVAISEAYLQSIKWAMDIFQINQLAA
jgi:EAL and modified HD-GYP domain-containing signal transduction protein